MVAAIKPTVTATHQCARQGYQKLMTWVSDASVSQNLADVLRPPPSARRLGKVAVTGHLRATGVKAARNWARPGRSGQLAPPQRPPSQTVRV